MVRFDDTLGAVAAALNGRFAGQPPQVTVVRDPAGALTVVLPDDALTATQWEPFAAALHGSLGPFSPGVQRVLLRYSDLIAPDDILKSPDRVRHPEYEGIFLLDRLLTNQEWLRPGPAVAPLPTATAFSIKGGVGRTTSLAVLAWHLARKGKRVLIIDLDLEAPGVGSLLLSELPDYGVVDWCVETLVGQADATLLDQMLALAPLADDTNGQIWVAPAFGRRTEDYVVKVGRAYMQRSDSAFVLHGLAERLRALLDQAVQRSEPPDVVLLDSRAGLSDLGMVAVTQLGAQVFLFAREERQSWDAFRHLFNHLRRSGSVVWGMPDEDLRWRLKMVAAQLDPTQSALLRFIDSAYSTWTQFYDGPDDQGQEGMVFERSSEEAPHYPLTVSFDPRVRAINLINPEERPAWGFVQAAFGGFLTGATQRLLPEDRDAGVDSEL